jgi:hypothetical protein
MPDPIWGDVSVCQMTSHGAPELALVDKHAKRKHGDYEVMLEGDKRVYFKYTAEGKSVSFILFDMTDTKCTHHFLDMIGVDDESQIVDVGFGRLSTTKKVKRLFKKHNKNVRRTLIQDAADANTEIPLIKRKLTRLFKSRQLYNANIGKADAAVANIARRLAPAVFSRKNVTFDISNWKLWNPQSVLRPHIVNVSVRLSETKTTIIRFRIIHTSATNTFRIHSIQAVDKKQKRTILIMDPEPSRKYTPPHKRNGASVIPQAPPMRYVDQKTGSMNMSELIITSMDAYNYILRDEWTVVDDGNYSLVRYRQAEDYKPRIVAWKILFRRVRVDYLDRLFREKFGNDTGEMSINKIYTACNGDPACKSHVNRRYTLGLTNDRDFFRVYSLLKLLFFDRIVVDFHSMILSSLAIQSFHTTDIEIDWTWSYLEMKQKPSIEVIARGLEVDDAAYELEATDIPFTMQNIMDKRYVHKSNKRRVWGVSTRFVYGEDYTAFVRKIFAGELAKKYIDESKNRPQALSVIIKSVLYSKGIGFQPMGDPEVDVLVVGDRYSTILFSLFSTYVKELYRHRHGKPGEKLLTQHTNEDIMDSIRLGKPMTLSLLYSIVNRLELRFMEEFDSLFK